MSTQSSSSKMLSAWLAERQLTVAQLAQASGVDDRIVTAIAEGRYTSSPNQRNRLARALGLTTEDIQWSQTQEVQHMYGHGPQFGRSP
jgi:plasmid maintenance system antidote protein VapI